MPPMKPLAALLPVAVVFLAALPFSHGETVKDREGAVRQDRARMEKDARWHYNDVELGFAEAKRTGKPLLSTADVTWVLHHAGDTASLPVEVRRGAGAPASLTLGLEPGWRTRTDISSRVGTWGLRGMATGGLVLEDLGEEERARRRLKPDQLALRVKYVGEYGKHGAGKKAGFLKEDILVAADGLTSRLTEAQLMDHCLNHHAAGDKVSVTVLRGEDRITLELPVQ